MEALWNNLKLTLSDNVVSFCLKLVGGILILVIGFRLVHWLTHGFQKSRLYTRLDPTAQPFITSLINILAKVFVIIIAAAAVGVPTASIIAVLGSAGVAIGLALQGSLSNLAGGIMILFYKPFKRGDVIQVGTNPAGTVEDISIFYTTLTTADQRTVVIPNGTVSNGALINLTAQPLRRVDVGFSVAYEADAARAREVILRAAGGCDLIEKDPPPTVVMTELGESAVVMEFHGWAKTADYYAASCQVRELVKGGLDAAQIPIPFPQMDVHMK